MATKTQEAARMMAGRSDEDPELTILAVLSAEARNGILRRQA